MKTIAVDIDDTLAAYAEAVTEFSNVHWGMNLTIDEYSENWGAMWGVDPNEYRRRGDIVEASGIQATLRHDVDAVDVLRELKNNYRLIVVSSRPANLQQVSIEWINRHYPGIFEEIHFANMWNDRANIHLAYLATKAEICQELKIDYLIDDQPKHCIGVANVGIPTILYGDYPWNRDDELPETVARAHTWRDVHQHFSKIGSRA